MIVDNGLERISIKIEGAPNSAVFAQTSDISSLERDNDVSITAF